MTKLEFLRKYDGIKTRIKYLTDYVEEVKTGIEVLLKDELELLSEEEKEELEVIKVIVNK